MRKNFEKMIRKLSCTAFDVAAAPMFIVAFGVPLLMIIAVVAVSLFAFKTILRISREKKARREE